MALTPLIFKTKERAKFFEIDPYGHMNTQFYVSHFLEHRMTAMREYLNWDLEYLAKLPVAFFMKDIKIDFIRSVVGDKEFEISSHVVEFKDRTCTVELVMEDCNTQKILSKCYMTLACFDKKSSKTIDWPDEIKNKFYTQIGEL